MEKGTIAILGINGRTGHATAEAFAKAGWQVIGLGRSNTAPIAGVSFQKVDANDVEALKTAFAPADIVFNGLNLAYDKWGNGRSEAQHRIVLEALKGTGKTMLFPGNIYNFGEKQHVITPETPQHPARDKGEIRVRIETMYKKAAEAGALDVIILRAGDFYGPGERGSYFDVALMSGVDKGKIRYPGKLDMPHSWAYLPDLGEAWVRLVAQKDMFGAFETFCFPGHFVTGRQFTDAVAHALPKPARATSWFPVWLLQLVGLFVPLLGEVAKMSYLFREPHRLEDPRFVALMGDDFGTPIDLAVSRTVADYYQGAEALKTLAPASQV